MIKTPFSAWNVLLRTLIGGVAGYYYASLAAVFVSALASGPRAERVIAGVLLSFLVHALIVIVAFSVSSLARLTLALGVSAAAMLAVVELAEAALR